MIAGLGKTLDGVPLTLQYPTPMKRVTTSAFTMPCLIEKHLSQVHLQDRSYPLNRARVFTISVILKRYNQISAPQAIASVTGHRPGRCRPNHSAPCNSSKGKTQVEAQKMVTDS